MSERAWRKEARRSVRKVEEDGKRKERGERYTPLRGAGAKKKRIRSLPLPPASLPLVPAFDLSQSNASYALTLRTSEEARSKRARKWSDGRPRRGWSDKDDEERKLRESEAPSRRRRRRLVFPPAARRVNASPAPFNPPLFATLSIICGVDIERKGDKDVPRAFGP